jgi:hypothetical protein
VKVVKIDSGGHGNGCSDGRGTLCSQWQLLEIEIMMSHLMVGARGCMRQLQRAKGEDNRIRAPSSTLKDTVVLDKLEVCVASYLASFFVQTVWGIVRYCFNATVTL